MTDAARGTTIVLGSCIDTLPRLLVLASSSARQKHQEDHVPDRADLRAPLQVFVLTQRRRT